MVHLQSPRLALGWIATLMLWAASLGAAEHETTPVSSELFNSLEELSRLVDISYCVGTTGVKKPFQCLSHCAEFPNLELIETWNTGILLSDSCGYVALSHSPGPKRIVVAFRGTYSITNTIIDLSAYPQSYIPYNGQEDDHNQDENLNTGHKDHTDGHDSTPTTIPQSLRCDNCTVHAGFMKSWLHTRPIILPIVFGALQTHPDYEIVLVGHSLGGAVATLAGLEMRLKGWDPLVTTFGAPMVGNAQFARFLDATFQIGNYSDNGNDNDVGDVNVEKSRIRRVTHVDDPVPLLPLQEWGYAPHAAEIYIAKSGLPPSVEDVRICKGDEDRRCIAGAGAGAGAKSPVDSLKTDLHDIDISLSNDLNADDCSSSPTSHENPNENHQAGEPPKQAILGKQKLRRVSHCRTPSQDTSAPLYPRSWNWNVVPARYRLWELFFAHRDYFWRIGLCVPSGDLFSFD
ncbi:Lipase A [Penicillium diatomitis]|uniref:Lipase A n=1 Tax=Penicillium diatomitis TaxID=2819901 RepID=A0A9W9WV54_9EURO|nr:Lipase A [Penicillium diatomitis]KAJ5477237.1 Lipase A [Penicillium diatomitis]